VSALGVLGVLGWLGCVGALTGLLAVRVAHARRWELVGRACHEVRGGMTAARLGLHLARLGRTPALATVEGELERVVLALDDLQCAREGRRAGEEEGVVELGALAREVALGWAPVARRQGATLCVGAGTAWVRGDARRLAQALRNLLANASEHGGGRVELTVRVERGRVRVSVEDGGRGLSAPVAELLRGAERRRRHLGPHRIEPRGHGLPVIADVARRHGGTLTSAPSARGARLVLDLPAAQRPARGADAPSRA